MTIREIAKFRRKLKDTDQALLAATEKFRKELLILVDEGFRDRKDPIGRRWKKRKRAYKWPILNKTLRMRQGFFVTVSAKKRLVTIGNDTPYTRYHQDGTRKMVARKMIPDRAIPPRWIRRMKKLSDAGLRRYFTAR